MLSQEDQGDRQDAPSRWHDKEWNQRLKARDHVRRRRLEELRAAGALQTGPDYYHAAMLYQHGDGPDDFWQAHEWSMKAVELGCEEARWLAAASYDRWLMTQGKLSAFNIPYWKGRVTTIDVPQALDPRSNPRARALLTRDIENVCRYFAGYGVREDSARIAASLWHRSMPAELRGSRRHEYVCGARR